MKNIKYKLVSIFLVTVVLLFNISCKNGLFDFESKGKSYICINMEENNSSRMVMPSLTVESLKNISLYAALQDGEKRL